MSFNAIRENKIIAKISENTVSPFALSQEGLIKLDSCDNTKPIPKAMDSYHSTDSYFPLKYRSAIFMVKNQ